MAMKRNIFHSASVKLAGLYLVIILVISFLFSGWLYNVSLYQIKQSIIRAPGPLHRLLLEEDPEFAQELRRSQQEAIDEARAYLIYQLVVLNIIIAIAGGAMSYYLARRTLKPIEEAHEAQSRFTADASHELRTPITAMRTETEITLTDPKLTLADAKAQLESNIEELDKLTALSENLLKLSRLDDQAVELSTISLREVASQAIGRASPHAEKKKQLITSKVPEIMMNGNSVTLVEALVILLDNAIKYSPEKTTINLSAKQQKQMVRISVTDRGVGIAAIDIPRIFERFYRADQSRTKNKVDGYGIGLSIVQATAQAHGGTVQVKSTPGKGSTFILTLPIRSSVN